MSAGMTALVRLRARQLDHLSPFLGFLDEELTEFGGRARERRVTELSKPRLYIRICEAGVNLHIQFGDDFRRCVLGRADAIEAACLVAGHKIADDGHVR